MKKNSAREFFLFVKQKDVKIKKATLLKKLCLCLMIYGMRKARLWKRAELPKVSGILDFPPENHIFLAVFQNRV